MASIAIVADFITNDDGDQINIQPPSNIHIDFPPVLPTDMVDKAYVDVSFPGGHSGGSVYTGVLSYNTPGTPLYNVVVGFPSDFTVNRVGNMVTICSTGVFGCGVLSCSGNELIGTGTPSPIPQEYWPAPASTGASVDECVAVNLVQVESPTALGFVMEAASVGIKCDGTIKIRTLSTMISDVTLGNLIVYPFTLSYLTSNPV